MVPQGGGLLKIIEPDNDRFQGQNWRASPRKSSRRSENLGSGARLQLLENRSDCLPSSNRPRAFHNEVFSGHAWLNWRSIADRLREMCSILLRLGRHRTVRCVRRRRDAPSTTKIKDTWGSSSSCPFFGPPSVALTRHNYFALHVFNIAQMENGLRLYF
jgi:hypothetical protein